jgi:hypothetical protein
VDAERHSQILSIRDFGAIARAFNVVETAPLAAARRFVPGAGHRFHRVYPPANSEIIAARSGRRSG